MTFGAALSVPRLLPAPAGAAPGGRGAVGAVGGHSGCDIRFWVHHAFLGRLFARTDLETRPFPASATRTPRCDPKRPVLGSLVSPRVSPSEEGRLRALSLWWDTLPGRLYARCALDGDLDVDVAVVGAGFTGLWTAYYLLRAAPDLRVAVLEKEVAGFGASGRNGGWCSALFAASDERLAREHGAGAARAMREAMQQTVDEVGHRAAAEGIECHFAKGGTIVAARNPAQVQRAQAELVESALPGLGGGRSALDVQDRGRATDRVPWHARCDVHSPLRRPRPRPAGPGIGRRRRAPRGIGLRGHGGSLGPAPHRVGTGGGAGQRRLGAGRRSRQGRRGLGTVNAGPAPGSTARLLADDRHRALAGGVLGRGRPGPPGNVLRPPAPDHLRSADSGREIGLRGRGAPYHFGSTVRPSYDRVRRVHGSLSDTLVDLFPALGNASVTHAWGGPLGVPRDWFASVGFDRSTGMAWAGGYVGDGVSTSNLAGRTLADLVLGHDSDLVHLPWVAHRSPNWEPEPVRWLEVNAALLATKLADRGERRLGHPSPLAGWLSRFLGH